MGSVGPGQEAGCLGPAVQLPLNRLPGRPPAGHGLCAGRVAAVNADDPELAYHISYEDGDAEDVALEE